MQAVTADDETQRIIAARPMTVTSFRGVAAIPLVRHSLFGASPKVGATWLMAVTQGSVTAKTAGRRQLGQGKAGMNDLDQPRFDDEDFDFDEQAFEKIHRGDRPRMPVSSRSQAQRNAKKTNGSKRVKKTISQKSGGMHRRRQRTVR